MPSHSCELIRKGKNADATYAMILSPLLDQMGVDLAAASAVSEIDAGPDALLTIAQIAVNAAAYTSLRKGTTYAAGQVLFFRASGGTQGERYDVRFTVTTADGQAFDVIQPIELF
jgi:hypothetical protein